MHGHGRTRKFTWVLVGAISFFVASTALWVHLDRLPPTWDDAFYLTNSLAMFDSLVDGGIPGYVRKFLSAWGDKPPLIAVLPTPAYLILGRHTQFAYGVNLCFMLVLLVSLFRLGSNYAGPRVGLIAVFVAGTMPMLYGLSRWYLVEFAMAALVAAAVCCLAQSKILWFSIVCGLGLLLKISFPLYVVTPFIYWTVTARPWRVGLRTCLPLALAVLLPLPWYATHYRRAFQIAIEAGVPSLPYYGFISAGTYFWRLIDEGPGFYYSTLLTLSIVTVALNRITPDRKGLVIAVVQLAPFAFFVFGPYQEPRYTAPLLPAFALLLALLLDAACTILGRWRSTATCTEVGPLAETTS
jgi:4-amino-4-deoxy-L-arabinose transferase-like glycosyltransferase